jgi:hypothetical protein
MSILTSVSLDSLSDVTVNPYQTLYLSVILQAILDASKPRIVNEDSSITQQRNEAQAWFSASVGVTCDDFEIICTYAGLSPITVRTFAFSVIKSGDTEDVRRKFKSLL